LFDQDGHPVVPTCHSKADARSGGQGGPKGTASRRAASWTAASTTAPSPQTDDNAIDRAIASLRSANSPTLSDY
jgi:hypothetical protein